MLAAELALAGVARIVADLEVAAVADTLEVGQLLDAVEAYRAPLHLVVNGYPPPMPVRLAIDRPASHQSHRSALSV